MKVFSNAGPLIALSKLGQLESLYRLFGQVGLPTAVYQEVVIRGSRRGYSDALLIEVALRRFKDRTEKRVFSNRSGKLQTSEVAGQAGITEIQFWRFDEAARSVSQVWRDAGNQK